MCVCACVRVACCSACWFKHVSSGWWTEAAHLANVCVARLRSGSALWFAYVCVCVCGRDCVWCGQKGPGSHGNRWQDLVWGVRDERKNRGSKTERGDLAGPPTERHMVGPRSPVYALHLLSRYGEIRAWQVTVRVSSQTQSLVCRWRTTNWNRVALFHRNARWQNNPPKRRREFTSDAASFIYKRQIRLCGSASCSTLRQIVRLLKPEL